MAWQKPLFRHQRMLCRCVHHLGHAPTLTRRWYRERWPDKIVVKGDTDWVGCPLTPRSTSGIRAQFGQLWWLTSCTAQVPISLSSGEAEAVLVRSASRTWLVTWCLGSYLLKCVRIAQRQSAWRSGVASARSVIGKHAWCLWILQQLRKGSVLNSAIPLNFER